MSSGQTFINILKFAVSLTLNTTIKYFLHKTLWLMIMYYQTKFGSKRISSSKDTEEIILIIWALTMTLILKTATQSFCTALRLIMIHHNTKFGNKMLGDLENIIWTNTEILTLHCDLDLECSYPVFFSIWHSGMWWCIIRSNLFAKESPFHKTQKKEPCFNHMSPCCDLDPEDGKQFCFLHNSLAHDAASQYQVW